MKAKRVLIANSADHLGEQIVVEGHVQALRLMGSLAFVKLRDRSGTIQLVLDDASLINRLSSVGLESTLRATALVSPHPSNHGEVELKVKEVEILSSAVDALPVEVHKQSKLDSLSSASMFDYRPLTLRSEKARAIFKIEASICRAFREFLDSEGFTEIHSPKIVSTGTEGGAQLFAVDYFGRKAYLAQSPQFYKQIMVGVFERVYEIGPVYRAEEHDTTRHLNEYLSMDFEMGFITSAQDLMAFQTKLLKHVFAYLSDHCEEELAYFKAELPAITDIPQVTLEQACRLVEKEMNNRSGSKISDLDPEGERLLCEIIERQHGSQFVYVTQYPQTVRPFYAMPLAGTELTDSFDLLFRGLEVTTGGQRIHDYEVLKDSIAKRGLGPETFSDYLQCFRYGMPPHGGLAIGLERLTKQLLGLSNVKLASLFPRDRNRISP
jgi:nondiscriminating aspartyl-tRNA synthetase